MMIDKQLLLSDDQAITSTGDTNSTDTIDLGAVGTIPFVGGSPIADIGRGESPPLLAQVTVAFTSGGSATMQVKVVTSASADLSSPTVIQETAAIAVATLTAGYQFRLAIPPGIAQRYLGLVYTVGTAAMTAGKVTAGIVMDKQTNPTV